MRSHAALKNYTCSGEPAPEALATHDALGYVALQLATCRDAPFQLSSMPQTRKLLERTSWRCGGVLCMRRRKGHVPPAAMQPHWRIGRRWATRPHPPVCFSH